MGASEQPRAGGACPPVRPPAALPPRPPAQHTHCHSHPFITNPVPSGPAHAPMKIQTLNRESKKTGMVATKIFSSSSCGGVQSGRRRRSRAGQGRAGRGERDRREAGGRVCMAGRVGRAAAPPWAMRPGPRRSSAPRPLCPPCRTTRRLARPHLCLQAVVPREEAQRGGPALLRVIAQQDVCCRGWLERGGGAAAQVGGTPAAAPPCMQPWPGLPCPLPAPWRSHQALPHTHP